MPSSVASTLASRLGAAVAASEGLNQVPALELFRSTSLRYAGRPVEESSGATADDWAPIVRGVSMASAVWSWRAGRARVVGVVLLRLTVLCLEPFGTWETCRRSRLNLMVLNAGLGATGVDG